MTEDIVAMFRRAKVAESMGDLTTAREIFSPDAVLYEPYMSGTMSGPKVADYIGTLVGEELASVEFEIKSALVDQSGDRAAIELTELVTDLRGRRFELSNCSIVERRDGKFIRWHEYLQPLNRKP